MRRIPAVIAAALLVGAVVQCSVNDQQRISLNPGPPIGVSVIEGAYTVQQARYLPPALIGGGLRHLSVTAPPVNEPVIDALVN